MTGTGEESRRVLMAIAAGRVKRTAVRPESPGRFLLDGVEVVDPVVVNLVSSDLVFLPNAGPPRLTPDGEWVLTNYT